MATKAELVESYQRGYEAANKTQIDPQKAEECLRSELEGETIYRANKLVQIETEMANLKKERRDHLEELKKLQKKLKLLDQNLEVS